MKSLPRLILNHFPHCHKKLSPLTVTLPSPRSPLPRAPDHHGSTLCLWIFLFWPFPTNRSIHYVTGFVYLALGFHTAACISASLLPFFFFKDFIYLFLERGKEGKREREKYQHVVASHVAPHWGPGPQPRHVPWLGIEPATPGFIAQAQSTELHQPGLLFLLIFKNWDIINYNIIPFSDDNMICYLCIYCEMITTINLVNLSP